MGICSSSETARSLEYDKFMVQESKVSMRVIKLLLLGTGSAGKSTIFKQMQVLYAAGFTNSDRQQFKMILRRNLVESLQVLLEGAERYSYTLGPEAQEAGKRILDVEVKTTNFFREHIIKDCQTLWADMAIQQTYKNRSRLQLEDSAAYLFKEVARIGAPGYEPNDEDILRARSVTCGIHERVFLINRVKFNFLDVGGQRNERRKWIHVFEGVTAVIFVTAISEYDQFLAEDEKVNRLHESLGVFESICNNRYFRDTAIILFLNKKDLFMDKIQRVPLTVCFPDYEGPNDYPSGCLFIEEQYTQCNQQDKMIFAHLTCATDTQNVQKVFDACRLVILKENLRRLGLEG